MTHDYREHEPTGPRLGVSCADCTTEQDQHISATSLRKRAKVTPQVTALDGMTALGLPDND